MDQDLSSTDGEVTAELAVDVPLLSDEETGETVTITAEDAAIKNGQIEVDLTVTVSAGEAKSPDHAGRLHETAPGSGHRDVGAVPAYKNPDALQAAYEQYDSFPEMTEALGVDVTSETVRRHMIQYDIHNPDDTTPKSFVDAKLPKTTDDTDSGESRAPTTVGPESDSPVDTDPETSVLSTDEKSNTSPGVRDEVSAREATSAITDGGNATVDGTSTFQRSPFASMPVRDVLAEASAEQCDSLSPRNSLDLPETLTVASLTDAINQSKTVHGVTQHVGVNRSTAKQLLQQFDLIDFVSHRLAADQITVSPDEVVRRIKATSR
jgi:hypothetical protein